MTDIFWDRIEPHGREPSFGEGLSNPVADPLWMLSRQWQFGEFRGEDAASPIDMRIRVRYVPLSSVRNEAANSALKSEQSVAELWPIGQPLESRVEAEQLPSVRGSLAVAAESGSDFLRRLDAAGLSVYRSAFREQFALTPTEHDLNGLPTMDVRYLQLLARRSLDGQKLAQATHEQIIKLVTASQQTDVLALWELWRDTHQQRFDQPGEGGDTWVGDRLEHQFSIATQDKKHDIVLSANEYAGGRLDWYSFDLDLNADSHQLNTPRDDTTTKVQELHTLAVPLAYAGMPASRFWEFEEGTVYYGAIEAGPADIGRLLIAEFATVYSDDWFLLPVRLPIGSLARVEEVVVRNTFGESLNIRSCAQWDHERQSDPKRNFAFVELTGDNSAAQGETPWLPLLPTLASTLHSTPLESVSFVRDEAANLAWAIEERIESATGGSINRRLMNGLANTAATNQSNPQPEEEPTDNANETTNNDVNAPWRYRLQSQVPPHWVPFIPQRLEAESPQVRLRRARLLAWSELDDPAIAGPKGALLMPDKPMELFEEEIPKSGVQVIRQWQLARGQDGSVHIWLSRHKRPGRGERGSGLAFDRMQPMTEP